MGKIKSVLSRIRKFAWSHKKTSIFIIILVIVLGYLIWPKSSKTILTETVQRQDVIKTVSVTGSIDAANVANLTFQTPERLSYVGIKLGDPVVKGQAIASLDQTILQATFRQAQQDFVAAKAASQQYYDNHTNATESDQEKVQRTAIDDAQNKAYDQMLKVEQDLTYSTLYTPIKGIVTRMDVQTAGVNITPATTFTVTDPTSLDFKMEVDEADIGNIKIGQNVSLSLDAFPNDLMNLKVDKIDFVSHTTSSGGNAYYVKANIVGSNNYRVGMNGNADIVLARSDNVLTIPSSSIFNDHYVYVKTANGFEKRDISLGLQSDTLAEVKAGVSEGEPVAVDPSSVPPPKTGKILGIL